MSDKEQTPVTQVPVTLTVDEIITRKCKPYPHKYKGNSFTYYSVKANVTIGERKLTDVLLRSYNQEIIANIDVGQQFQYLITDIGSFAFILLCGAMDQHNDFYPICDDETYARLYDGDPPDEALFEKVQDDKRDRRGDNSEKRDQKQEPTSTGCCGNGMTQQQLAAQCLGYAVTSVTCGIPSLPSNTPTELEYAARIKVILDAARQFKAFIDKA